MPELDKKKILQDVRESEPRLMNVTDKSIPGLAMKNEGDVCTLKLSVKVLRKPKKGGSYMLEIDEMEYVDNPEMEKENDRDMVKASRKDEFKYVRPK